MWSCCWHQHVVLPRFATVAGKLIADVARGLRPDRQETQTFAGLAVILFGDVRQQYTSLPQPCLTLPPLLVLSTGPRPYSNQPPATAPAAAKPTA